jgi:phthalate 4,5-cis-dihydrodiol dehydrogenase
VDIVRLLGGGRVRSVRAAAGSWDPARPTEGAYTAFLSFEGGAAASLTYSGHARFDSDEFCGWVGELGQRKEPAGYGTARRMLQGAGEAGERVLKAARSYGGVAEANAGPADLPLHQHFGLLLVCCERADLRPLPTGVMIYSDDAARLDALPPPAMPRSEVVDELYGAIVLGRQPVHGGEWGLATLEVCLAMLKSAREGREIMLEHQVGLPDARRGAEW